MPLPFPFPALESLLHRTRDEALAAFVASGWRRYATPITLDAETRRRLNIDLTEPDVAWPASGDLEAVAHVEADRAGRVVVVEVTGAQAVEPRIVAEALLDAPSEPRVRGDAEAREFVWGADEGGIVAGQPVRLWICTERAYGDRLWAVASATTGPR